MCRTQGVIQSISMYKQTQTKNAPRWCFTSKSINAGTPFGGPVLGAYVASSGSGKVIHRLHHAFGFGDFRPFTGVARVKKCQPCLFVLCAIQRIPAFFVMKSCDPMIPHLLWPPYSSGWLWSCVPSDVTTSVPHTQWAPVLFAHNSFPWF